MPRKPPDERIKPIGKDTLKQSSAEKVRQLFEQRLQDATRAARRPKAEEPKGADQFRMGSLIPKFLKAVQKRLDSSWIYRTFKLPGTSYIVRDLRKGGRKEDASAFDKKSSFKTDKGHLSKAKEKSYVNYLGDRGAGAAGTPTKEAAKTIQRLLSEFEKLLVERFEKGRTIEQKSADGKPHYNLKTESQWRSFFSKFFNRTIWRKAHLKTLQEFIFRGLVTSKAGAHSILIGDMAFASGQIQKFARLRILAEIMEQLANLKPGENLTQNLLRKGLGADEFRYLALAHKHGEQAIMTGKEATKGMFGLLKAEDQAAEQLGLKRRGRGKKGYGGPIKWGEEGEEEKKHAFVPFGFWERERRKGHRSSLLTAIVLTIAALIILVALLGILKYL